MNRIHDIITELITEDVGKVKAVSGGSINNTYSIHTSSKKYFLKLNEKIQFDNFFYIEAKSLDTLRETECFRIPKVEKFAKHYLLMELIEPGLKSPNFWKKFAHSLAHLHQFSSDYFGLEFDNYIGDLPQSNNPNSSWTEFFANERILPLVKSGFDQGVFNTRTLSHAESFCNKLNEIFPVEQPSLLHGDLWSGNIMSDTKGQAVIFDPAIYFGHREMDIAMTKLFGGFDPVFYKFYESVFPLETGWEQRINHCNVYPLLVHALLFKGSYVSELNGILKEF